jgi:hypothetical protein
MTNEQEKSDLFIVAMKLANKPGRPGAEPVEPRKRTEGNTGEQHTCRTQSRANVSQRLDWVRGAARGVSSLITRGGSPVRELRPPGSVRGVPSNGHPYRDVRREIGKELEREHELRRSAEEAETRTKEELAAELMAMNRLHEFSTRLLTQEGTPAAPGGSPQCHHRATKRGLWQRSALRCGNRRAQNRCPKRLQARLPRSL